jgi:hypothetical protein
MHANLFVLLEAKIHFIIIIKCQWFWEIFFNKKKLSSREATKLNASNLNISEKH